MSVTPEEFRVRANVSRETLERFRIYAELLARWNRTVNLVAAGSLADSWERHFLDCAQLYPHLPGPAAEVVDLGSGAGFPGLVLAIMGARNVHLVESHARKAAFLREAARRCGVKVRIHVSRIEGIEPWSADIATARALAPLDRLLEYAFPFIGASGEALFLKGGALSDELTEAKKKWRMHIDRFPSITDPAGTILKIRNLSRVGHS